MQQTVSSFPVSQSSVQPQLMSPQPNPLPQQPQASPQLQSFSTSALATPQQQPQLSSDSQHRFGQVVSSPFQPQPNQLPPAPQTFQQQSAQQLFSPASQPMLQGTSLQMPAGGQFQQQQQQQQQGFMGAQQGVLQTAPQQPVERWRTGRARARRRTGRRSEGTADCFMVSGSGRDVAARSGSHRSATNSPRSDRLCLVLSCSCLASPPPASFPPCAVRSDCICQQQVLELQRLQDYVHQQQNNPMVAQQCQQQVLCSPPTPPP
eukprot:767160-Hanusia_phi.AAC.8